MPPVRKNYSTLIDPSPDPTEHYSKNNTASQTLIIQNETSDRFDKYGKKIEVNGEHRISFKKPLKEVYDVENWKDFNIVETKGTYCGMCQIF